MKFPFITTFLIIPVLVLLPFSYAQNYAVNYNDNSTLDSRSSNNSQTLEDRNKTQLTSNEQELPNFVIAARVTQTPNAFSFNDRTVYELNDPNGVFVRINSFDWNETKYYEYLSDPNRIDFSENSIDVNIAFKLPISNTTSKIERLNAQFPVQYIITEDNQTEYQGYSSYPILINGTEIQPHVFFTKLNDGTTSLVIENYPG